jgi:hypothetical protein
MLMTRRSFLAALGASAAARGASPRPPIRALTKGPKFHWFGYYDKWQFDTTSRYALGMEVDFEHRSPRPDDVIRIGMIDTAEGDRWTELGTSSAWCWQQGCMLQWVPGSASQVLAWAYHPSRGDKFYLYRDRTDEVEAVGREVMTENGHCTYLPGNRWILNDVSGPRQARAARLSLRSSERQTRPARRSARASRAYRRMALRHAPPP